jgi:hypothetical protein
VPSQSAVVDEVADTFVLSSLIEEGKFTSSAVDSTNKKIGQNNTN